MLFYTILLLASLAVALVILWLYRLTSAVFNRLARQYRVRSYSRNVSQNSRPLRRKARRTTTATMSRYGNSHAYDSSRRVPAKANFAVQSNWTGKNQPENKYPTNHAGLTNTDLNAYLARKNAEKQSLVDWSLNIGRPVRDDRTINIRSVHRMPLTGQSGTVHNKGTLKPWGW